MTPFFVAITALLPVTMVPGVFFHYAVVSKAALLLFAVGVLILNVRSLQPGLSKLRSSRLGGLFVLCISLQLLLLLISSVFSKNQSLSIFGTGWRRLGAVEYAAILIVSLATAAWIAEAPPRLRTLLRGICFSGVAASLYGICQYLGLDPFLPKDSYRIAFGNLVIIRPPSTFGNATYFANYLVLVIFAAAGLVSCERSRWARTAGYSTAGVAFIALLLTGTRAGVLGVAVGVVFLVLRTKPRITKKAAFAMFATALALIAVYFTPVGDRLRDRAVQWTGDSMGGPRLMLWRDSLKMAAAHPALGTGPETFATEFPFYQSASLARAYPNHYHETPHNICLDALLSQGIPGLILLLGSLFLGVYASFRAEGNQKGAISLAAGVLGVFVSQQFTTFEISTALFYHMTIAVLVALGLPGVSITPIAASHGNRLSFLAAPVGALFLVIAADLAYIDWCWAAIQRSLSANQIEAAMRRREFTKRLLPREPGMDLWYSRGLLAASARITSIALRSEIWAQSLDSGQRAVDTSDDRPNALYNLAFLYSVDGNIVEAEATARLAVVAAPNWFKPHWLLAEMLSASGRFDDAEREAGLAVDLNGGKNPEVSEAIQRIRAKNQVNKQLW